MLESKTYGEFFGYGSELSSRIKDELAERQIFILSLQEGEHASNPRRGWEEIIKRFADSAVNIEEMVYCFALERYAAAVFHSLQVVEIGLIDNSIINNWRMEDVWLDK